MNFKEYGPDASVFSTANIYLGFTTILRYVSPLLPYYLKLGRKNAYNNKHVFNIQSEAFSLSLYKKNVVIKKIRLSGSWKFIKVQTIAKKSCCKISKMPFLKLFTFM